MTADGADQFKQYIYQFIDYMLQSAAIGFREPLVY